MGTDKMKVLPVLALASAHAYTVFEIDGACDLEADPQVPCTGTNEMCNAEKKCACLPGYPSADGKVCAEEIAAVCDDATTPCADGATCTEKVCDCTAVDACKADVTLCDAFCNLIPVVETTAAVTTTAGTTAEPFTGTTVAETTTAAPEGGSAMSYSLAVSTLMALLMA